MVSSKLKAAAKKKVEMTPAHAKLLDESIDLIHTTLNNNGGAFAKNNHDSAATNRTKRKPDDSVVQQNRSNTYELQKRSKTRQISVGGSPGTGHKHGASVSGDYWGRTRTEACCGPETEPHHRTGADNRSVRTNTDTKPSTGAEPPGQDSL